MPTNPYGVWEDDTSDYVVSVPEEDSEQEDGPAPTHGCMHCDRTAYIESEPRTALRWCPGADQVTRWPRLDDR